MDDGERAQVCSKLEWEGGLEFLIYGGEGSDFPHIKDKHFHELRAAFVVAAKRLDAYMGYESFLTEEGDCDEESDD